MFNEALKEIYKSADSKIEYADVSAFTDAFTIAGKYTIKGNEAEAKFIIKKGNEVIKRFDEPMKGTKDKLHGLAKTLQKVVGWVNDNK